MGEEVEEFWADNDNVAIIDFLDDIGQPYSCSQWGSIGNPNLPIIINDGASYNFHDQFSNIYATNVFIDHEMKVNAISAPTSSSLDTTYTAGYFNDKIQEMLDNLETELSANYKNITPFNFQITNLFPNPFNPILNIDFEFSQAGWVKVEISDITGAIVNIVYDGYMTMGKHQKSWNSENLPSGVYFVSLQAGGNFLTSKVVLLK